MAVVTSTLLEKLETLKQKHDELVLIADPSV